MNLVKKSETDALVACWCPLWVSCFLRQTAADRRVQCVGNPRPVLSPPVMPVFLITDAVVMQPREYFGIASCVMDNGWCRAQAGVLSCPCVRGQWASGGAVHGCGIT